MKWTAAVLILGLLSTVRPATASPPSPVPEPDPHIRPGALRSHMTFLADDLLEGRGTATRGYRLAANYAAAQFAVMGLAPAGEGGTYFQEVPLRVAELELAGSAGTLLGPEGETPLIHGEDLLFSKHLALEEGRVEGPLVYVGYGVTAPEFDYDDYAALDVRGKILILLRGAPPSFPHNERAFYADQDGKYANAAARGAVGIFVLRTPKSTQRYPWEKSVRLSRIPSLGWVGDDGQVTNGFPEIRVRGSLSLEGAKKIFEGAARSLDDVLGAADQGRPSSIELPRRVRLQVRTLLRDATCRNVAAMIPGSDPVLGSEVVVYTAHLDHLGMDETLEGDRIYNGALDNASGVAVLLEVARAMASLPRAPARSVLFLAVTGEEKGMLGSEYFAANPTVPAERIVADVNLDMFLMLHPCLDLIAFGAEHSTLGGNVERAASRLGVALSPDPEPEELIFIRSDQYSFVKIGVPSVFLVAGRGTAEGPEHGRLIEETWDREIYHSPADDMRQPLDFEAGAVFARICLLLGLDLAQGPERPAWNEGDFFGARFARR